MISSGLILHDCLSLILQHKALKEAPCVSSHPVRVGDLSDVGLPIPRNDFGENIRNRTRPAASVARKAITSDWSQTAQTDDNGEFSFTTVPLGDYRSTVTQLKFEIAEQTVTVASGPSPILHFQLAIASVNRAIVVFGQHRSCQCGFGNSHHSNPGHRPNRRRRSHQRYGDDHQLHSRGIRAPRYDAHARKPSGQLAD